MKVELKEVTVRELVSDYKDELNFGVTGYGGRLDIRPIFQREFVYHPKKCLLVYPKASIAITDVYFLINT